MENVDYEMGKLNELRESIRAKANEISHQMTRGHREYVRDLLGELECVEGLIEEFDEILSEAWDSVEVF